MERGVLESVCAPSELRSGPFTPVEAARIWTSKEAVVKTLGTGFFQGGVDFPDVDVTKDKPVRLYRNALRAAPKAQFELHHAEIDGAFMTIALRFEPNELLA